MVIENVSGSISTCNAAWQKYLRFSVFALGYQFRTAILNAALYQTPQSRERVIMLAARADATLPPFPRPFNPTPRQRNGSVRQGFTKRELRGWENLMVCDKDLDPEDSLRAPVVIRDIIGETVRGAARALFRRLLGRRQIAVSVHVATSASSLASICTDKHSADRPSGSKNALDRSQVTWLTIAGEML